MSRHRNEICRGLNRFETDVCLELKIKGTSMSILTSQSYLNGMQQHSKSLVTVYILSLSVYGCVVC